VGSNPNQNWLAGDSSPSSLVILSFNGDPTRPREKYRREIQAFAFP